MFTQRELNVLLLAVANWKGPYPVLTGAPLTETEKEYEAECKRIAGLLASRFEELLMEQSVLEQRLSANGIYL